MYKGVRVKQEGHQEERVQWNVKRVWTRVLATQLILSLELPGEDLSRAFTDLTLRQVST